MNWKPIKEAPKDGTRIMLCDAYYFTAGGWEVVMHEDTVSDGMDVKPNPMAGTIESQGWLHDNLVAFKAHDELNPRLDELLFEPTHFAEMIGGPEE